MIIFLDDNPSEPFERLRKIYVQAIAAKQVSIEAFTKNGDNWDGSILQP